MILQVEGLEIAYGPVQVIWSIDLNVQEGEIVALVGPNGAGKTTLLKGLAGLLPPLAGEIHFAGAEITRLRVAERVKLGLILSPEGRQLFPGMTVTENLTLGAYLSRDRQQIARDLEDVFELFPRLYERRNHLAGLLSGGEQQMCAVGRALMARPRLLMIDELSLGLSPAVTKRLGEVLRQLNQSRGLSILLVEQDVPVAFGLASRAYVLENGTVRKSGGVANLTGDPEVREAYLGLRA